MKKIWKWIIIVIVVLLCLRACGSRLLKSRKPADPQPAPVQEEPAEIPAAKPSVVPEAPAHTEPVQAPSRPEPEAPEEAPEEEPEEEPAPPEPAASTGIRPEFKEAMDSYEAFYKEYCSFMKQYADNPTDLSLLGKYADMLTRLEEMDRKFEAWNEDELSSEELKYYLDVNSRVQKMLSDLL